MMIRSLVLGGSIMTMDRSPMSSSYWYRLSVIFVSISTENRVVCSRPIASRYFSGRWSICSFISIRQTTQSWASISSRLSSVIAKCSATRAECVQSSRRVGRPLCCPVIIWYQTLCVTVGSSRTAYLAKLFRIAGSSVFCLSLQQRLRLVAILYSEFGIPRYRYPDRFRFSSGL